jgi:hypothetical protein
MRYLETLGIAPIGKAGRSLLFNEAQLARLLKALQRQSVAQAIR